MDCKAVRKSGELLVRNLILEPGIKNTDAFTFALVGELLRFMQFNNCHNIRINKVSESQLKPEITRRIDIALNR
jgi:uncharacterized protein YcaQ